MSDIPRYLVSRSAVVADRDAYLVTDQIRMVTYADHVAALAQAEVAWRDAADEEGERGRREGQRDERERIRRFVLGLTTTEHTRHFADTILWHIDKGESDE